MATETDRGQRNEKATPRMVVTGVIGAILLVVLVGIFSRPRSLEIPDTTMVRRPHRVVTPEDVVVQREEDGVIHLYLDGFLERESHVETPLRWPAIRGNGDLSVELKSDRGEPGGSFRFWFGSVTDGATRETRWLLADGTVPEVPQMREIAESKGIDLDRWLRSVDSKRGAESRFLRLVGGFERVDGFVSGSYLLDESDPSLWIEGSGMSNSHTPPPQYVTVEIPKNLAGNEDLRLAVDLAWGAEVVSFDPPEVGSSVSLSDFDARIVFKEKGAQNSESNLGTHSNSFSLGKRNVPCTTIGFFLSDPGLIPLIFPKVIVQRSGREEVRYFLPLRDVPTSSVPVRIEYIEKIEMHYRNHRNRVVFPIDFLPSIRKEELPSLTASGEGS